MKSAKQPVWMKPRKKRRRLDNKLLTSHVSNKPFTCCSRNVPLPSSSAPPADVCSAQNTNSSSETLSTHLNRAQWGKSVLEVDPSLFICFQCLTRHKNQQFRLLTFNQSINAWLQHVKNGPMRTRCLASGGGT
jgi:hypothetical protein